MMLSVAAFRMVLDRLTDFTASDDHLDLIKGDVERYCRALEPDAVAEKVGGAFDLTFHWRELGRFSALS